MTRNPGIPLALLLSLLACDQVAVAPVVESAPNFVQADINKNEVVRFQDHIATSWTDQTSGLRATHTTFPIPDFDDEPERDCGPQDELAKVDFQHVGVVDLADFFLSELHLNGGGPVWVIVRDMNQAGDCYGVKLVAEGPGTIHYVDNDAFGQNEGEAQANSWGFIASGTLTTPDGRTLTYQGISRYVVTSRGGEPTFSPVVERVILH